MAKYYVSSSRGNDTYPGTAPTSPWGSLEKVFGKAFSSAPFQPGDSILLKRGDTFQGSLRLKAKGLQVNPIVVDAYDEGPDPLILGDRFIWYAETSFPGVWNANIGDGGIVGAVFENGVRLKSVGATGINLETPAGVATFLAKLTPGTWGPPTSTRRVWVKPSSVNIATIRAFRWTALSIPAGSSYITVRNLRGERFSTGMDVEGSIGIELQNCKVKDTLSVGIYLRLNDISCKVIGCDVRNTGGTGIYVYKAKDTLVQDCSVAHVTDKSMGFTCTGDHCGIGLQESERTRVLHNLISDVPLQSGVDYYFDVGSQVMYNSLLGVNKGIYPHGAGCVVHGNLVHLTPGGTGSNAVNTGIVPANGPTEIRVSDNVYFDAGIGIMADATKGPVTVFGNTAYAKSSTVKLLISTGPVSSWDNCLVVEEVPA